MPLPLFVLWGAAALLAGTGVVKGVNAMSDFDRAKEIGSSAAARYEDAQANLLAYRDKTNTVFESLGKLKISIFNNQIKHLVEIFKKYKDSSSKLSGFDMNISIEELKALEALVLKSLEIDKGLASGAGTGALAAMGAYSGVGYLAAASTGTAISGLSGAAATNATLAWLGGGALSAGGFGMAGGVLALGGIVLGPALAIGGFMMASKAEEALTAARKYEAEVDIAIAQFKESKIVLAALQEEAKGLASSLSMVANRFDAVKVYDNTNNASFEAMVTLGKGLKGLLDIALMEKDGTPIKNVKAKISGFIQI